MEKINIILETLKKKKIAFYGIQLADSYYLDIYRLKSDMELLKSLLDEHNMSYNYHDIENYQVEFSINLK